MAWGEHWRLSIIFDFGPVGRASTGISQQWDVCRRYRRPGCASINKRVKSPIVVFTSMENMPTIVITPPHVAIANTQPLHIAFNAHGLGHYDAAFWASPETQQLSQESMSPQQPTCSCGRKSTKGTPCSLQLNVYTTRCPCYNLQSGCNHKCRCKNCQNPYGKQLAPAEKPATGSKRKFEPHTYQKQSLKGIKTMEFMNQVSEPVKTGAFSIIETLLISAIIQNL